MARRALRARPRPVERLEELTWREAAAAARDPRSVVLLPVGAVEQHGPHLPLLVDWLGAEEIARRLAPRLRREGWRPVLAPALPYGVSTLAERWGGTVSLSIPTFARLVAEIVRGLAHHGFRRVVLANYQADPEHLRGIAAARKALARAGVQVLVAGFSPDASEHAHMLDPRVLAMMRSPRPDREWHSGELETALVLATRPRLVRRAIAARLRPNWVDFRGPLARGARRFEALGANGQGYFGWPRTARAETGRRVIALRVRLIGDDLAARLAAWRPRAARGAARRDVTRGGRGAGAHEVDDHDHRHGDEQHGRGRRVVDHPQIRLQVEADAAGADEPEHGRGPDVRLEAVEDVGEEQREHLGQDAEAQHLQPRGARSR